MENEIHNFPYIKLNRNGDLCLKVFFVLFCFSHVDYIVCSPWPLTSQERKMSVEIIIFYMLILGKQN